MILKQNITKFFTNLKPNITKFYNIFFKKDIVKFQNLNTEVIHNIKGNRGHKFEETEVKNTNKNHLS